jgi:hypothetical protein
LLQQFARSLASSFPREEVLRVVGRQPLTQYQRNPVGYLRKVLGLNPWPVQEAIAQALLEPPYRVAVKAVHSVGKTWLAAALTSWFYDCFPNSAVITTAPTARDVRDLLWTEVRASALGRGAPRRGCVLVLLLEGGSPWPSHSAGLSYFPITLARQPWAPSSTVARSTRPASAEHVAF